MIIRGLFGPNFRSKMSLKHLNVSSKLTTTSPSSNEKLNFWAERWQDGKIPWHITGVNKFLRRNFNHITKIKDGPCRILVPLCGKAIDLRWLCEQGHNVVGIEAVNVGILEFFHEQNLTYEKKIEGGLTYYSTPDKTLTIINADLFGICPSQVGKFDGIWDRTSLIAIDPDDQPRYATLMKSLLNSNYAYLLNTMVFDESECSGPPFSISKDQIQLLYGKDCKVQIVEMEATLADPNYPYSDRKPWNLKSCYELILLLNPAASS